MDTEKSSKQIKKSRTNDMDEVGKKKKNKKHAVSDDDTELKNSVDKDENGENVRKENNRKKKKKRKLAVDEENKEEKQGNSWDGENEKDEMHKKKKRKLADDEYENRDKDLAVKKKSKKEKNDGETHEENLVENVEKKKQKKTADECDIENPKLKTDENGSEETREENVRKKKKSKKEKKEDGQTDEENLIENSEKKKKEKKTDKSDSENPKLKTDENDSEEMDEENVRKKKKKKEKKTDESDSVNPTLKTVEYNSEEMNKENVRKKKKKKEEKTDDSNSENLKSKTDENVKKKKKKEKKTDENDSKNSKSKPKKTKKVSFSSNVEVFPSEEEEKKEKDNLVRGKRFTLEEDEIIKEAVHNYLNTHYLGEEGLEKVLHCSEHRELKDCWKEIASAIPYRPHASVYYRAHILFQRGEKRKWTQEEYDFVIEAHSKHGKNWKLIADEMGKHRFHVKDTWRRIKLENANKGQWSQNEYQKLFNLVNMDLEMKVSEDKKSKHGMLRDNICWEAISDKLSTRSNPTCCMKWYNQLTSPMVRAGVWADVDDYKLLDGLYGQDACCSEDVDWDELVEGRSGEVCRKRWDQMVMHIGQHRLKSFGQQVDILANRYCPNLIAARQEWDSKPYVDVD